MHCTGDPGMAPHSLARSIEDDPHPLVVFDAVTQHDLERIARASLLLRDGAILCGAGGLAEALAIWWQEAAVSPEEQPPRAITSGPLLVVAGSFNPVTARQLAHLAGDFPAMPMIQIGIDDLLKGRVKRFVGEALDGLARGQSTVIATELVTDGKEKAVRKNPRPRRIRRLIVEPRLVVR